MAVRVPLWRCQNCGREFSALDEKDRHERDEGHVCARIPVWEVKEKRMEAAYEGLARRVAGKLGLSYEDYMAQVREKLKKSPIGTFSTTIIWSDARRLGLLTASDFELLSR